MLRGRARARPRAHRWVLAPGVSLVPAQRPLRADNAMLIGTAGRWDQTHRSLAAGEHSVVGGLDFPFSTRGRQGKTRDGVAEQTRADIAAKSLEARNEPWSTAPHRFQIQIKLLIGRRRAYETSLYTFWFDDDDVLVPKERA